MSNDTEVSVHKNGDRIVLTVPGEQGDNGPRRMGYVAGRYAQSVGKANAMDIKAVRRSEAELRYDWELGITVWEAVYDLKREHLPMDEMFKQMRENDSAHNAS